MGFKQLLLLTGHFQVSSVWLYLEWCGQGSQMIHFNPCLLLCSTCSRIPSGTWASCSCVSVGKRLCGPLMFPNHTLSLDRLDGLAAVALMWPHQGSFISHVCLWSYAIAFVLAWRSIPISSYSNHNSSSTQGWGLCPPRVQSLSSCVRASHSVTMQEAAGGLSQKISASTVGLNVSLHVFVGTFISGIIKLICFFF